MIFSNIRQFHERINTFFHLFIAVPLPFIAYIFLEKSHNDWTPMFPDKVLIFVPALLSSILVTLFIYMHFRTRLENIRERDSLSEKFNRLFTEYRKLYFGILFANLLLLTGYYLTGSSFLIGAYVILLFALSFYRPYYDRYVTDLQLSSEMAKKIRKLELDFAQEGKGDHSQNL